MSNAARTANLRRNVRRNVNVIDTMPSGPNAGFLCTEYAGGALLRIKASNPATEYGFKIFTFEDAGGNDWIEDPAERRRIPAGFDYTRRFEVAELDRIAVEIDFLAGGGAKVDIFWTFS